MKRKIYIAAGIVAAILIGLAAIKALQIHAMIAFGKSFVPPPETISSAVAHEEEWQDTLSAVGSIDPQHGLTMASEVAGTVAEIAVADGTVVAKGDLLLRLDTSSEEAQLREAEAQTELSRLNAERTRRLRADSTVSQSELDQAEATLKQNEANADFIRAAIEKKTIRAPFAGRLGIWLVTVGQSLEARQSIVPLQSLTPVYADFSLPQQNLAQLKTGLAVQATSDAYSGQKFDGLLTAINPALDAVTRSVTLRATFENTNQLLRPGMFVRVEVVLPEERPALSIPATAILSAPYGDSVYVIEPQTNPAGGLVVQQQFIRTGESHGDFVSVLAGLKPGDRVVSAGLFKLRNGMAVTVNNEIAPKPSMTPNPPNG
ncbi:MAG: efflux RND transporter periplasmic adaptor subunit [Verrucomicrobiota bacterium]|jgi:membrane fusion protein (multidrug efflux system)